TSARRRRDQVCAQPSDDSVFLASDYLACSFAPLAPCSLPWLLPRTASCSTIVSSKTVGAKRCCAWAPPAPQTPLLLESKNLNFATKISNTVTLIPDPESHYCKSFRIEAHCRQPDMRWLQTVKRSTQPKMNCSQPTSM